MKSVLVGLVLLILSVQGRAEPGDIKCRYSVEGLNSNWYDSSANPHYKEAPSILPSSCEVKLCVGLVYCVDNIGRSFVTDVFCQADKTSGICPTANTCVNDQTVIGATGGYPTGTELDSGQTDGRVIEAAGPATGGR